MFYVLAILTFSATCTRAQTPAPNAPQPEVVLTKLGPITYPIIARTAHITGDVGVDVEINKDGTVKMATAVSGPPLLYRVALQSARESRFECRNCSAGVTPYRMLYRFRLIDGEIGNCPPGSVKPSPYPANQTFPVITQAGNHVIVVDRTPPCYADVEGVKKVRSWKCLYLWRCGRQWF
jgi:Gram-negative bacterial TonB protein C-terminal